MIEPEDYPNNTFVGSFETDWKNRSVGVTKFFDEGFPVYLITEYNNKSIGYPLTEEEAAKLVNYILDALESE
jgi:hypothetical protein